MARVTVEDCLRKVEGRFDLAILAARRAKMIQKGSKPLIDTGNKSIVTALREIAAGKAWFEPKKSAASEAIDATFVEETPETEVKEEKEEITEEENTEVETDTSETNKEEKEE